MEAIRLPGRSRTEEEVDVEDTLGSTDRGGTNMQHAAPHKRRRLAGFREFPRDGGPPRTPAGLPPTSTPSAGGVNSSAMAIEV